MRIGIFGFSGSLAHAGRMVAVARHLADRHDVTLFGRPARLGLLRGADALRTVDHDEPDAWDIVRGMLPDEDAAWFARGLAMDRAAIRALDPKLVIVDNRRTAGLAAELEGRAWISLTSTVLLGPHCALAPTVEELVGCAQAFGALPVDLLQRALSLGWTPETTVPVQAAPLPPWAVIPGTRPRSAIHQLNFGDATLVLDHPQLLPVEGLPPGAQLVGPILPDVLGDDPELPTPYTLVSVGGTGSDTGRTRLVEALVAMGEPVVATGAPIEGVRTVPTVGAATFEHAARIACHGGATTLYRSAAAGVPVLAAVEHREQALTAFAFARAGHARVMAAAEVGVETVGLLLSMPQEAQPLTLDPDAPLRALDAAMVGLFGSRAARGRRKR